jgi:hypothetical protein
VTVLQTQSRCPAPVPGWLPLVEFVWAHGRTLRAERRRASAPVAHLPEGVVTPEARAEAELRCAYRMWFGGDLLRGL